jgi:excisionase family DNA binding protein
VDRKLEVFTMHASKQKSGQPMKILQPAFEPLLDSDEAAALLKIHPKTLQRLARTGEIRGLQVGKLCSMPGWTTKQLGENQGDQPCCIPSQRTAA